MANDCCGRLMVVAKDKETIDRLYKILLYEDSEYCLSGCRYVEMELKPRLKNDLWYALFDVSGAWNCSKFFDNGDRPPRNCMTERNKIMVLLTTPTLPILRKNLISVANSLRVNRVMRSVNIVP